jgi:hypothetical protein
VIVPDRLRTLSAAGVVEIAAAVSVRLAAMGTTPSLRQPETDYPDHCVGSMI